MLDLREIEKLVKFAEKLDEHSSYSVNELAKLWGLNEVDAKKILRKLRREGFIKRTRSGRYKLSLAGMVIVKLFKMVRK